MSAALELHHGELVPAVVHRVDPTSMLARAFLTGYRGRTREAYGSDLDQWGLWCAARRVPVLAATRAHLQAYARHLEEDLGRAPGTVARKLSTISGFYAYAVAEGVLPASPAAHVRRPTVSGESPRLGLGRGELGRLLGAAADHGDQAHLLVCLLALNGLRVSEAVRVGADDLDCVRGHQVLAVVRKGGKVSRAPLAPRTAAAFTTLLPAAGLRPDGRLLPMDRFAAWRLVRALSTTAGITKTISPHSLRHTFVTLSLDAGVSLRDVQDAAGHADPRTTRRYDRARESLDRHATYTLAAFVAPAEDDQLA